MKSLRKAIFFSLGLTGILTAGFVGLALMICLFGTGTYLLQEPEKVEIQGGTNITGPSGTVMDYDDDYAKKIMELDLEKIRVQNPPKEIPNTDYQSSFNAATDLEIYLLLCEICQRPEINPAYSDDPEEQSSPDAKYIIQPWMIYGIWYHETGAGSTDFKGTDKSPDKLISHSGWGSMVGPLGHNTTMYKNAINLDSACASTYISSFENPDCPDEMRAFRGSQKQLQAGQAQLPDGTVISYDTAKNYIRTGFEVGARPNPYYVPDAFYTAAEGLRNSFKGAIQFGRYAKTDILTCIQDLESWVSSKGWDEQTATYLMYLFGSQFFSSEFRAGYVPGQSETEPQANGLWGAYRVYLEMALQGVPLDFWGKEDTQWYAPPVDTTRVAEADPSRGGLTAYMVGFNALSAQPSMNPTVSRDGIIQRLDRSPRAFHQLMQGFLYAWTSARNGANVTEAKDLFGSWVFLNEGVWLQRSIYDLVDSLHAQEKFHKKEEEEYPDLGDDTEWDEPGNQSGNSGNRPNGSGGSSGSGNGSGGSSGSGNVSGSESDVLPNIVTGAGLASAYANQAPRVAGETGKYLNKWYIKPGVLSMPLPSWTQTHEFHEVGACSFSHASHLAWGHPACDLAAPAGTTVSCCIDGVVVSKRANPSGVQYGFGTYYSVLSNINGSYFVISYPHMQQSSADLHEVGDVVKRGAKMGTVGSTGDATGPHLHFQINIGTNAHCGRTTYGYSPTYAYDPGWSFSQSGRAKP